MTKLPYAVCDADSHYYEPEDCLTRHADPRTNIVEWRTEGGKRRLYAGDRRMNFLSNPTYDRVAAPGALRELFMTVADGNVALDVEVDYGVLSPPPPAYMHRDPRLAMMDEQNIQAAILVPSLGVTIEAFLETPDETYSTLRAFNEWLYEDWGFSYKERIFAPPLMSLVDPDRAAEELTWALSLGARIVHLRPGPAAERSPGDPAYDRFWSILNEAGAVVACHQAASVYNRVLSELWGESTTAPSNRRSAFQHAIAEDRPVMDMMAALVLHNVFGRFPNVKAVSIENGAAWVSYLLKTMDKAMTMGRRGPWIGGKLSAKPSEIFRQHCSVAPFPEEDPVGLSKLIGVDSVLMGSDFPHPEGLAEPTDFADALESLSAPDVKKIMHDNLAGLLCIGEMPALR